MVQDPGGSVPNIQKNPEQGAVLRIAAHAAAQGFGVFKRSKRTVNPAEHLAQRDFLGRPF